MLLYTTTHVASQTTLRASNGLPMGHDSQIGCNSDGIGERRNGNPADQEGRQDQGPTHPLDSMKEQLMNTTVNGAWGCFREPPQADTQ